MAMHENPKENFAGPVRVMQIIVFALTMGLLSFLAVVCLALPGEMRSAFDPMPLVTCIGLGLAAMTLGTRLIVVQVMTTGARREILRGTSDAGRKSSAPLPDVAERLVAFYQTRMIVSAALLEGPAFFLLIAYLIERSPWSLAAAIFMILGVAAHFPTQQRVAKWVEQQMSRLEDERQLEPTRQE
jgi:hypothetical protein